MSLIFHSHDAAIAALITPPGVGGVAIVRLSGPQSLQIAQSVCSRDLRKCQSHRLYRCCFRKKRIIDEGLVVVMAAPRSFTGEQTVEFHLHGSPLISHLLVRALVEGGAMIAHPGEFTYRAFCHGKLDLAQAEAINDLINADSSSALQIAHDQLTGQLSKCIVDFKEQLIEVAAEIEASIDFPDEDLQTASFDAVISQLDALIKKLEQLSSTYCQSLIARKGLTVALLGRPNVGKSSLLNAMLQKERAIVTARPGTTRDILREPLQIDGQLIHLVDTAGIRSKSNDEIEMEGMRRTHEAIASADLVLFVLETTMGWTAEDLTIYQSVDPQKTLIVWNKIDLAPVPLQWTDQDRLNAPALGADSNSPKIALSAHRKTGFDQLYRALKGVAQRAMPPGPAQATLATQRHFELINKAIGELKRSCDHRDDANLDLMAGDIRSALLSLQKIVGGNVTEDLLSTIFSTFCLGK